MDNTVSFVIGDKCGDGHGRSETFSIIANLCKEEIQEAYLVGTALLGFDLIKTCCDEYDDSMLSREYVKKIVDLGGQSLFKDYKPVEDDDIEYEEDFCCDAEKYFKIYLFIVKLGDSNFEYKTSHVKPIHIGGYGLYN